MDALVSTLWVLLVISSVLIIALVLFHRGRGGGIADVFGGGLASGISSSASGEKNLGRITWGVIILFTAVVVLLGLAAKYTS